MPMQAIRVTLDTLVDIDEEGTSIVDFDQQKLIKNGSQTLYYINHWDESDPNNHFTGWALLTETTLKELFYYNPKKIQREWTTIHRKTADK